MSFLLGRKSQILFFPFCLIPTSHPFRQMKRFQQCKLTELMISRPQGVGMGRSPPLWLKDGDKVEVELEGVGVCTNKIEHVQSKAKL